MKLRIAFLLPFALAACATTSHRDTELAPVPPPPPLDAASAAPAEKAGATLYAELGGQPAVEKLVDVLIAEIHGDKRIAHFFATTDIPDFRKNLIDQLCQAAGGPCTYEGRSMAEAHSGLHITNKEFDQFVEDLNRAMGKAGLSKAHQQKLLAILGPMRPQIINQ